MGNASGGAHIQPCSISPNPPPSICGTGLAWSQIFNSQGHVVTLGSSGLAAVFVADQLAVRSGLDNTTYSGAGTSNKNDDPISSSDPCITAGTCPNTPLLWASGNLPTKDDLSNTYAYAATAPNGDLVVYSGFERISPSGDSHIDIGLFQGQMTLNLTADVNNACSIPRCNFLGQRTVGDLIVSMDFLRGGSLGNFSVREWTGSAFSSPLVSRLGGEGCSGEVTSSLGVIPAGAVCAFNNGVPLAGGPWPSFDSHGRVLSPDVIPTNGFTNFGIDVTQVLQTTICISTFIGETRSSGSFDAELKDFAGPVAFPVCKATIAIAPNAVNEVGTPHTFTVTVNLVAAGFSSPAPDNTPVTVTLTDANGAVHVIISNTCATNPGTLGGTCTITFTSNTAGTVTGTATATVTIQGVQLTATTNGESGNSGPAVKRFVDGFVTIGPSGINSINIPHTFTVNVFQNNGLGGGFVPASSASISVTLTPQPPLTSSDITVISNSCGGQTPGTCSITFTSDAAGFVIGTAAATFNVDGVTLTRSTSGSGFNSGPAQKQFVSGTLAWSKVDNAGNLLVGATFEVCRTANFVTTSGTSGVFVPITPVCFSVTDNLAADQNPAGGQFLLSGLQLGRYTVQETAAPPGFALVPSVGMAELTIQSQNAAIAIPFTDQRPVLKLTQFGYTNSPTGTPTSGPVSGTTVYTVQFTNFGGATASLTVTLTVTVTGAGSGTFSCPGGCTQTSTASLAANGGTATFNLEFDYSSLPNGAVVTAILNASYTLNGLTRTPSGTPASISFTIQSN